MTTYVACTIVARNYIAQARVLHESFRRHNAEISFVTLLVDGLESDRGIDGIGQVALPGDLGLEPRVLDRMQTIYDVMEFSTALKPGLLMHQIREGASAALYFDPDIEVFDDLTNIFEQAEADGVLLTPHTLQPMPRDGKEVSERSVMLAGIYNLGFIGVGASCYHFLAWWNERLRYDAISDPAKALFTDQRWIDWVPALFPHRISRDEGLNVAHWNLHERPVSARRGAWYAGSSPLRFLHFSGYDARTPWLLSKHTSSNPRVELSSQADLRTLCDAYGASLVRLGIDEMRLLRYRHADLPNGLRLTHPIRRLIRAIIIGDIEVDEQPPLAFAEPDAFVRWLLTPGFGAPLSKLTPLEVALWLARVDLQSAFPDIARVSGDAYRDWFKADIDAQAGLAVIEALDVVPATPGELAAAPASAEWSVVSLTVPGRNAHEVGERIVDALVATGVALTVVGGHADDEAGRIDAARVRVATHGAEDLLVIAEAISPVPTDVPLAVASATGRRVAVVIGRPAEIAASDLLTVGFDEIWVVGEFVAAEVARLTGRQIGAVAFPADPRAGRPARSRSLLGLPEGRLVVLDAETGDSLGSRGVLRGLNAFYELRAPGTSLVVPIGDLPPADRERARDAAVRSSNIVLLEQPLTPSEWEAVVAHGDVLLALHPDPASGWGATLALESGTAVVAADTYPSGLDGRLEGITLIGAPDGPADPLVEALRDLLENEDTRRDLVERAAANAHAARSLAVVARQYFELTHQRDGVAA